jgi:hypothetical protein
VISQQALRSNSLWLCRTTAQPHDCTAQPAVSCRSPQETRKRSNEHPERSSVTRSPGGNPTPSISGRVPLSTQRRSGLRLKRVALHTLPGSNPSSACKHRPTHCAGSSHIRFPWSRGQSQGLQPETCHQEALTEHQLDPICVLLTQTREPSAVQTKHTCPGLATQPGLLHTDMHIVSTAAQERWLHITHSDGTDRARTTHRQPGQPRHTRKPLT